MDLWQMPLVSTAATSHPESVTDDASDEIIAKHAMVVVTGSPRGNPADMPPPLKFADGAEWSFGKPDLVVSSEVVTVERSRPICRGTSTRSGWG